MIVRLMGEGQYRFPDEAYERLNEIDERALRALERDDEAELDQALDEMAALVRAEGTPLPADDLSPSDAVIPPSDFSLEETREFFSEQGAIPDLHV